MNTDTLIRVAINCILLLIIIPLWFVLASKHLYTPQMIPLYYPGGIVLVAIAMFMLNKFAYRASFPLIMVGIAAGILLFVAVSRPIAANPLYRDVLGHYYSRYPASTLLQFPAYMKTDRNYISVIQALEKSDIRIKTIEAGTGDGMPAAPSDQARLPKQMAYLINGDTYAIYDWSEHLLVRTVSAASMLEQARKRLEENEQVVSESIQAYFLLFKTKSGMTYSFDIYAEDGELKLMTP